MSTVPSLQDERKQLEKIEIEWQTPDLAKGEVEMRQDLVNPSEASGTLKSSGTERVSSDVITEKEKRDLGFTNLNVAGDQSFPTGNIPCSDAQAITSKVSAEKEETETPLSRLSTVNCSLEASVE
jgi:hypothetical protein